MEVTRGHQQSSTVSIEIPVWYGGAEKWITGIHRRTTCDDVVKALLGSSDPSKDQGGYVLVERWRKVERALDSKSRIMKLWNKWGDEQCNVKLSLKRIHQSVPQLKVCVPDLSTMLCTCVIYVDQNQTRNTSYIGY